MKRSPASRQREDGASAVEYGLLVAAIAAIIVVVIFAIGAFTGELFGDTCSAIESEPSFTATQCS